MKTIKTLYLLLPPHIKKRTIILIFLMLIGVFLETISIFFIFPTLAAVVDPDFLEKYSRIFNFLFTYFSFLEGFLSTSFGRFNLIIGVISAYFLIFLIRTLMLVFITFYQAKYVADLNSELTHKLFKNYLSKPWTFFLKNNSAGLIRGLSGQIDRVSASYSSFFGIFIEVLILISVSILLVINNPTVSLILLILLITTGFLYFVTKKKILQWGKFRQVIELEKFKHLSQTFMGIKELKLLGKEFETTNKFKDIQKNLNYNIKQISILQAIPRPIIELMVLAVTLILIIVSFSIIGGNPDIKALIPSLGLFIGAMIRFIPSFNKLLISFQFIRFSEPSINDYISQINYNNTQIKNKLLKKNDINKKIEIKKLSFSYNDNIPILTNIDLDIFSGSLVGICGSSGAGKSTFLDLLVGLLKPSSGNILVDDINLQDMNISYWNNKIGYLAQRTYLMDESIEKNIIYSHEKILDRGRINEVIKLSQLEEYIDKLPEKLATRIGENGILISGGQMQRIGIARALYTKPSLLILDEPTSAMDYENELQFLNMIKTLKNKVTVVIVTHRQTTLNICDQKYKLEDKQLKKIK